MFRVNSSPLVDGVAGNANPILVASTNVKYTQAINVSYAQYFSLSYILSTTGTPDIQIDIEESVDGNPPISEGSSSSNFIIPSGLSTPVVTDEITKTWKMDNIGPITARWIRFVLTGKNSNPSDTKFAGYIHLQEQID